MFFKNFKISHKLFLGFGIVIVLMFGVLGYIYINFIKQSEAIDLNADTNNVIIEANNVMVSLVNMQSGSRGFALAGKEEFLDPFNNGKSEYELQFNELKILTLDNPRHQDRLIRIESDMEKWLEYQTNNIIEARRKINAGLLTMEELVVESQKGISKSYMDDMKNTLNEMIKEERELLKLRKDHLEKMERMTLVVILLGGIIAISLAVLIALLVIRMIEVPVSTVTNTFREIAEGDVDLDVRLDVNSGDELGHMSMYFNQFMSKLRDIIMENRKQNWLKTGQSELSEKMRGDLETSTLGRNVITYISKYVSAQIGIIYNKTNDDTFRMLASYSYKEQESISNEIKLGEGIIGQVAAEKQKIIITDVPYDYITIATGIGEAIPSTIIVIPCISNDEVVSIIELCSFNEFTSEHLQFIEQVSESIAVTINSAEAQAKVKELLNKTIEQSEELQAQQEELRQINEELEEQAKALKESNLLCLDSKKN